MEWTELTVHFVLKIGNFFAIQMLYIMSGKKVLHMEVRCLNTIEGENIVYMSNLSEKFNECKSDAYVQNEVLLLEIKSYKANMFRIANSILRNNADAEDAVSDSILIAYTNLHTLRTAESFKPWIMKILVRTCYKIQKKRRKIDYYDVMPDIPVTDNYNTKELWWLVNQLDYKFRNIVILFYYEDMSIKMIAETLSLSQGTVKSRLSRSKAKLKQLLEKNGGFDNE